MPGQGKTLTISVLNYYITQDFLTYPTIFEHQSPTDCEQTSTHVHDMLPLLEKTTTDQ